MKQYQAVEQQIQITMTCANCHTKAVINPAVEEEVRSIEAWLKVQKSSGESFAYCGFDCIRKGVHNLKPHSGIEVVSG